MLVYLSFNFPTNHVGRLETMLLSVGFLSFIVSRVILMSRDKGGTTLPYRIKTSSLKSIEKLF